MSETKAPRPGKPLPRRALTMGVLAAGLAIALAIGVSNGPGQAGQCAAQPEAHAAIDAAAQGELAALLPTAQGRGYKDLAFQDGSGKPMSVADFSGKTLLINFWASWCVPCREEMPELEELAAKYNSDAFQVLPINLDIGESGLKKAQAFLDEGNWPNLPLYADPSFRAFERLKQEAVAVGLPVTLLVDEKGCEIAVLQGPAAWASPDGERVVEALTGLKS